MTISRSRMDNESRLLSSYVPHLPMAVVMGRFRTMVRNSAIGGTPGGIIASSRSATSGG